jgi:hypothetical protein
MLAGVSTRKHQVVGEPVGAEVEQESSSTSKSGVPPFRWTGERLRAKRSCLVVDVVCVSEGLAP